MSEFNHVRRGEGEPYLLVHGLGSHLRVWQPVLDELAAHHDVIAVDLPGFGATPPGDTTPSVAGLADALEKFLARLGVERPHVGGSSLGGGIALELGRRGIARSVTAFSPIGFWGAAGRRYGRGALTAARGLGRSLPPPLLARLASSAVARAAMLSMFYGRPRQLAAATVIADTSALVEAPFFGPVRDSLREHVFVGNNALDAIPVTIAWGTRDRLLIYRTQARRARALLPAARHIALPGCGHLPFHDDPRLCARVLLEGATA